jgi:hypothetical protein
VFDHDASRSSLGVDSLALLLGNREEQATRIDFASKLKAASLESLEASRWPSHKLIDFAAAEGRSQSKKGVAKPFAYIDLSSRAAPEWAFDVPLTSGEGDSGGSNKKHDPSLCRWASSFFRLALCQDAVGQWALTAALSHSENCFRIGDEARLKSKPLRMVFVYDELVRKLWSERAQSGVSGFDVNVASLTIDEDILRRAENIVVARDKKPDFGFGKGASGKGGESDRGGARGSGGKSGSRWSNDHGRWSSSWDRREESSADKNVPWMKVKSEQPDSKRARKY